MIKITLNNENVEECKNIEKIGVGYLFVMFEGTIKKQSSKLHMLSSISKIEKQVKDLTSNEIYTIFSIAYGNDLNFIEVCEDRIVINVFDYGEKNYIEYFYDDYVDITELVKG